MLNMACTLFRMTPEEALSGVTRNGARALGLLHKIGTLEKGKDADFVLWEITDPAELAYRIGFNPLKQVVRHGRLISKSIHR
jgi:imidazolonepropionase